MRVDHLISTSDSVLVTGANGFIGTKVVQFLIDHGITNIRCFVRPSSKVDELRRISSACPSIQFITGDLLSREDTRRAAGGVSVVFHLAAGFDKAFAGAFMNSALATRNLIESFLEVGKPKRFVNVSSFAVYSNLHAPRGAVWDESWPLEDNPQERHDAYGFGKLKQEELVREYGKTRGLPYVILRPGAVFGPGKKALSGRIGIDTFGVFLQMGGSKLLPLTYVDNCAEAIVLAGIRPGIDGEIFNVVDNDLLTSGQFLRAYKKKVKGFSYLTVPYFLTYGFCQLWERYCEKTQGQLPPAFNRRRCAAEWKGNRYSNQKLRERLGWEPRVGIHQAMAGFLSQFD